MLWIYWWDNYCNANWGWLGTNELKIKYGAENEGEWGFQNDSDVWITRNERNKFYDITPYRGNWNSPIFWFTISVEKEIQVTITV